MIDRSDIGSLLREARNASGWSLEDVAHRTRIPVKALHYLEANDYSQFPSRTYAKSFLSQYARYLGVDILDWLDCFEIGDVLADLDRYEYLKDHSEESDEEHLVLKDRKESARPRPVAAEPAPRAMQPGSLQPFLVFMTTASLLAVAIFGFAKLSDEFASERQPSTAPLAEEEENEVVAPVAGFREAPTSDLDLSAIPRALPVGDENPLVTGNSGAARPAESPGTSPQPLQTLPSTVAFEQAPPRAVIVEE